VTLTSCVFEISQVRSFDTDIRPTVVVLSGRYLVNGKEDEGEAVEVGKLLAREGMMGTVVILGIGRQYRE